MIGKVMRGRRAGGLLYYLYGPGRANEHVNRTSWRGGGIRPNWNRLSGRMAGGISGI